MAQLQSATDLLIPIYRNAGDHAGLSWSESFLEHYSGIIDGLNEALEIEESDDDITWPDISEHVIRLAGLPKLTGEVQAEEITEYWNQCINDHLLRPGKKESFLSAIDEVIEEAPNKWWLLEFETLTPLDTTPDISVKVGHKVFRQYSTHEKWSSVTIEDIRKVLQKGNDVELGPSDTILKLQNERGERWLALTRTISLTTSDVAPLSIEAKLKELKLHA